MTSLLDKFNEIQKLEFYIDDIKGRGDSIYETNFRYYAGKEYHKEFHKTQRFCEIYFGYNRKEYNSKALKNSCGVFGGAELREERNLKIRLANKYFVRNYLTSIRKKYRITEEKYIELNNKLEEMKKQYEIDKLEQELQQAEEKKKIMEDKKAVNKANRLKKQNDIKTFCECCNKEYIARSFKTHLESEKHKKNETKFNA